MKNLKNLQKTIEKLNKPTMIEFEDGIEMFESEFNFQIEERNGNLVIYDKNENYNIDYLENLNDELTSILDEFEFGKFEPETVDKIHEELEEAIKKDLGKDAFLEWEDSVVMIICGGKR